MKNELGGNYQKQNIFQMAHANEITAPQHINGASLM